MAFPHENCAPGDVCCTGLYDVADVLLEVCHTAVVGCSACDCDLPGIVGYVSMGREIQDPTADYVAVSLLSIAPAPTSNDSSGALRMPLFRATFQVKLLESGWPMPFGDENEIIVPEPELVQNCARHAYAHGEAMYRAAANALLTNQLNLAHDCYRRIEPILPVEPSGGTAGWQFNVVIGWVFGAT